LAPGGVNRRVAANGLRGLGSTIAQHTGSDAHTDAQFTAYAIRLHKKILAVKPIGF
jgi:hypothetical protein